MFMNLQPDRERKKKFSVFHFLAIVLLSIGIFFRFVNIDRKVAWMDECITLLRLSDYHSEVEMEQKFLNGQEFKVEILHQSLRPNPDTNAVHLLKETLVKHPEHPPLYYMLGRLSVEWFGSSIAVLRTTAAAISLLAFPAVFWLCWELFDLPLSGWLGLSFISVSPLYVLYAQEPRQYSLWIVSILLSSAALLRAMRVGTKISWLAYTITVVLGLYSHLFFALVAIAQAIYAIAMEKFRLTQKLIAYLAASAAAFLLFLPWIWIVITTTAQIDKATDWSVKEFNLLLLPKRWVGNLSRVFLDFGFDESTTLANAIVFVPLLLGLLILIAYSFYFLCSQTSKKVWLFILTLIAIPLMVLLFLDVTSGRLLSGTTRYLMPPYIGVQLTVIYLFSAKMTAFDRTIRSQQFWSLVFVAILTGSVLSCVMSFQARVWWSKGEAKHLDRIAKIVNQTDRPVLVVSDDYLARILALSYLLKPESNLQLADGKINLEISKDERSTFLFNPSENMKSGLGKQHPLQLLYDDELQLFGLEK